MSCRTGPLRVARPLRGVYTGLGLANRMGRPPAGRLDLFFYQWEDNSPLLAALKDTSREVIAPRLYILL
jgi:hypothetical protein